MSFTLHIFWLHLDFAFCEPVYHSRMMKVLQVWFLWCPPGHPSDVGLFCFDFNISIWKPRYHVNLQVWTHELIGWCSEYSHCSAPISNSTPEKWEDYKNRCVDGRLT